MCCNQIPRTIRLTNFIHAQYPDDIKEAWQIFDDWWQENYDGENKISKAQMPAPVLEAFNKICDAPVPMNPGFFGRDTCSIQGVLTLMTD